MRLLSVITLFSIMALGLLGCGDKSVSTSRQMYFGFYQFDSTEKPDPVRFKSPLNLTPHVVSWSLDFDQAFPIEQCSAFHQMGIAPLLRWEPWLWRDEKVSIVDDILSGQWDFYLRGWATSARDLEMPILISFAPDFNSERYPWGIQNQNQDPERYKALYRYVVNIFREEGARNVIWVFTYLARNTPDLEWNKPILAYPGDDVVNWVGISSVNEVDGLKEMFSAPVATAAEHYPTKPIMINAFFYENTGAADKKMAAALTGPLARVNAILLSNPKMLPKKDNVLYTSLFSADMEEFNVLHLGL